MSLSPAAAPPPRTAPALLFRLAAAAYVFVAAFPDLSRPGGANLDGSWILAINQLAHRGFGESVVFTYGPLGFLLYPTAAGLHAPLAAALRLATVAALAALAFAPRASPWDVLLFALAQSLAVDLGLGFEYQVLVPLLLLVAVALDREGRAGGALLALLGAVAGAAFLAKFSLGISLSLALATACALRLARDGRRALLAAAAVAVAGAGAFALLGSALLSGKASVLPWARRSLEIASAYSEAMSLSPASSIENAFAVAGGLAVVALAAVGVWAARQRPLVAGLALLAVGPAFLAFKHAFVRQDGSHAPLFFPFLLALAGTAALFASGRRARIAVRALLVAAAGMSLAVARIYDAQRTGPPSASAGAIARALAGVRGAESLSTWVSPSARRRALDLDLSPYSMPGLREFAAGRPVGIVPFELAICAANDVACSPNPTLQTYAAYTSDLDRVTAEHYSGAEAPPLVALRYEGFDDRSPALDTPALWRALAGGYRLAPFQPGHAVVLERVPGHSPAELREVGREPIEPGRWLQVPEVLGPLYASIDLEPALAARFARFLFRIPSVWVEIRYGPAETVAHRIVPGTARDGLPLDQLPTTGADIASLFSGRPGRRPVALRIYGDGLEWYRQPLSVTWLSGAPR